MLNGTANGVGVSGVNGVDADTPVVGVAGTCEANVKKALLQYNKTMDALEAAEAAVQTALQNIKDVAGSATVHVDTQYFQIRERRGKLYLCELNGKPKGRPVGSTKKDKAVEGSVDVAGAVVNSAGVDAVAAGVDADADAGDDIERVVHCASAVSVDNANSNSEGVDSVDNVDSGTDSGINNFEPSGVADI